MPSGQIPDAPVVITGSGPLILLYACQLLDAVGRIAAILDTPPRENGAAARKPQERPRQPARTAPDAV